MTAWGVTVTMTHPPSICHDPVERARLVAELNCDFPRRVTWETDGGCIWSVRKGPYAEPMTLDTDNPWQMRELLADEKAARPAA